MEFKNIFINRPKPNDTLLLRRHYYINGCHAGDIFYSANAADDIRTSGEIVDALASHVGTNSHVDVSEQVDIAASVILTNETNVSDGTTTAKDFTFSQHHTMSEKEKEDWSKLRASFPIDKQARVSNVYIRIKDERTPAGNFFFCLDQLKCVSIINNSGLTPLLEVSNGYIDPSVTYVQFINFLINSIADANKHENQIRVYDLIINDETVREITPAHK
ncbi:MAG: hypothetical protein QRY16_04600 [Enterobacterales bacterium endosymbiont of Blomia tropicalis]|uniref:hypothetical protein n=1 Tax=Mixta mediterraneensis TaxID=2758443 RepID=UPI0025A6FF71|nr:hypothetical protein [Mixta mediterraneensis]MDL4913094.1 hypothetical protein [Mixta mediterraneensis]